MAVTFTGNKMQDDEYNFDIFDDLGLVDGSGSGSGSRIPRSYYDTLAAAAKSRAASAAGKVNFDIDKYNYEQSLAAAALARQQAGAAQQKTYLESQLALGIPKEISGEIDAQEKTGYEYIQNQAANLLSQLQARQGESTGLTQTGFSNLQNYLARNQPTAFAQAQRARPTITQSDLGQYMTGQGVSPAAAQEASTLANIQSAGGASNYNQLLNVLAAREASGQKSRESEAQMGLTSQLAQLQAIYGQATGGLEQSRLQALADLSSRSSAARLQAQREAAVRKQALEDAIAQLIATGLLTPTPKPTTPVTTPTVTQTPVGASAALNAIAAGTTPPAGIEALLELIAQAQQDPNRAGGDGGGGGGIPMGNAMVAF